MLERTVAFTMESIKLYFLVLDRKDRGSIANVISNLHHLGNPIASCYTTVILIIYKFLNQVS